MRKQICSWKNTQRKTGKTRQISHQCLRTQILSCLWNSVHGTSAKKLMSSSVDLHSLEDKSYTEILFRWAHGFCHCLVTSTTSYYRFLTTYSKHNVLKSEAPLHFINVFSSLFTPYLLNIYFFKELITQILVIRSMIINIMSQMTSALPLCHQGGISKQHFPYRLLGEHRSLQSLQVQIVAVQQVSGQWLMDLVRGLLANLPSMTKWPACTLQLCLLINQ